ncbi:MAG: ABC transporter ATP-binding protein [Spirochaetia bacterium]
MLEIRDLEVYIGKTHVLKEISFSVGRGELVALIGANGAGKTTSLAAIAGLLPIRGGTITFTADSDGADPRELTRLTPEEIVAAGISLCPEGRQVFTALNVRENLMIGAYLREDRSGIKRDLDYVYGLFPILAERKSQAAGSLSGGEQMMLAIGRALMSRPKLLMLDEPSLGLAPMLVEKLFGLLKTIHADGTTILLVEQNASMALETADRAYVLETGRLTLSGTGKELMGNPAVQEAYLGLA